MSTIVIGVDASERSEDAVAFGRQIARASGAHVIVASAFPYSDTPSRRSDAPHRTLLRDDALKTARRMRDQLTGIPGDRSAIRVMAQPSPAHALHDLAHAERAALLIVGSTHTAHPGRILPGSTGQRLLQGSPCAVAIAPNGYRTLPATPIRRIGVAYNGTDEARAAANAAAGLARALAAELEIIWVVAPETYASPALMGGPSVTAARDDIELHAQRSLDAQLAELPDDLTAHTLRLTGGPAEHLVARSAELDLLVTGSRGYGPLRSVLVGGVSGRLTRTAHCPVIVVPRGIEAPLDTLFDHTHATAA